MRLGIARLSSSDLITIPTRQGAVGSKVGRGSDSLRHRPLRSGASAFDPLIQDPKFLQPNTRMERLQVLSRATGHSGTHSISQLVIFLCGRHRGSRPISPRCHPLGKPRACLMDGLRRACCPLLLRHARVPQPCCMFPIDDDTRQYIIEEGRTAEVLPKSFQVVHSSVQQRPEPEKSIPVMLLQLVSCDWWRINVPMTSYATHFCLLPRQWAMASHCA